MAKRKSSNYMGDTARYIITMIAAGLFGLVLFFINMFLGQLLPPIDSVGTFLISFAYNIITIALFVGTAIVISDKIVGLPKVLSQPLAIYVITGFVTGIALLFWYILAYAFPTIFTSIYADVIFSVIVAWIYVNMDNN